MRGWLPIVLLLVLSGSLIADCLPAQILMEKSNLANGDILITAYVKVNNGTTVYSPKDVYVSFFNKSDGQYNSGDLLCDKPQPKYINDPNSPALQDQYYYECTVKKEQIKGGCADITARVVDPPSYCTSQNSVSVCDADSSMLKLVTNTFTSKITDTAKQNYGICLVAFLMLGVLLATMFFSGKSPMSLLDITTPNLPAPKTLAASGQLLGQMVYGRMKKANKEIIAKFDKAFEAGGKQTIANISPGMVSKINALVSRSKGDASTKSLLKFLALKMAERPDKFTEAEIDSLFKGKSLIRYTEQEHGELGKIVQRLRMGANSPSERILANSVDAYVQAYTHLNKMEILTGESGEQRGVMDFLYKTARLPVDGLRTFAPYWGGIAQVKKIPLVGRMLYGEGPTGKNIGWLGNMPIIGGFTGTAIDSVFRSARVSGRYLETIAGSTARLVLRTKSDQLKRMGEALEQDRLAEKGTLSYGKRMLYRTMTAGSAETMKIGGFYPIHNRMAELYRTLYKEAHYDAMAYELKQIYAHLGVDLHLSEADFAALHSQNIDVLQRSGILGRRGEVERVEERIRQVLAQVHDPAVVGSEYELLYSKVRELRAIADSIGARIDGRMDTSLARLRTIHEQGAVGQNEHVKLGLAYAYLSEEHGVNNPKEIPYDAREPDKFYFKVGRDSLTYVQDNREVHSDLWSQFNLRKLIYSAELAASEKVKFQGGIEDVLKETWLYTVNRMMGLGSPLKEFEKATDREIQLLNSGRTLKTSDKETDNDRKKREDRETRILIGQRIGLYMESLLTDEGNAASQKLGGWKNILTGAAEMQHALGGVGRDIRVEFGDQGRPGFGIAKRASTVAEKIAEIEVRGKKIGSERVHAAEETVNEGVRSVLPQFGKKGIPIAYYDKDGAPVYWGEDTEIGPRPTWWKVDMKRDWITGNSKSVGAERTIGNYIEGIFEKGYKMPYKASVYRGLTDAQENPLTPENVTKSIAETKLKPAFARDALVGEIHEFMNGTMAMNAYAHTNETVRFYMKTAQGMLANAILDEVKNKKDGEPEYEAAKANANHIRELDFTNHAEVAEFNSLLASRSEAFLKYLKKPVTYDMFVKSENAWVMLHEGGFAPFVKGMPLSDFDRVIGGYVAIKDSNGKWRRFDPMSMDLKFEGDTQSQQFKRQIAALQQHKDKTSPVEGYTDEHGTVVKPTWEGLLNGMAEWAKGNHERQKLYNAVLWKYAQATGDWHDFWDKSDITIRPKHEVMGIRTGILPYGSHEEMSSAWMEPMRKAREMLRGIGMWVERTSIYAAGANYRASYDINPVSEFFRERYWDLTRQIRQLTPAQVAQIRAESNGNEVMNALGEVAKTYSQYHMVWDFGIDRNPWRHSTSYGLQSALASSFHYGPAATWDPSWYKAYFPNKAEYYAFESTTFPVRIARYMALPAITAFRSFQMNLFGYPNKWNYQENAMEPWSYRSPDLIGAVRSLANPFYASLNWFSGVAGLGATVSEGEMVRRDTGGAKYRRGLKPVPAEIAWIYKGTYSVARDGEANPGISRYDARRVLHVASPMAEYLAYRSDFSGYYSQDEYLRRQSDTTHIKREVAGPALALRREEELKGYSLFTNAIHAWWNPVLFLWHLPISPISPRDMYMHYKEGTRRIGEWERMSPWEKTKQVVFGPGGGMLGTAWAQVKPWYTDETGRTKVHGLGGVGFDTKSGHGMRKDIVYCSKHGIPIQRWMACPKCLAENKERPR